MKLLNRVKPDMASMNKINAKKSTSASDYRELHNFLESFKKDEKSILLSIILPMYNEENTIRSILEALPKSKLIEIIIIDDNSTDNSLKEIHKVKNYKEFKIIHHLENRGYGNAILTGMQYATGDVIVSMDTDGQHSPKDIFRLIKPIFEGKADYTIGSRYLGTYHYRLPITTRLGEVFVEKFFRVFFGIKVMNNQNGFRAFTKELIPVFSEAKFLGYAFCTEKILQAKISQHQVLECPIKVYDREYGYSKIKLFTLTLNILASLLIYYLIKFKFNVKRKRKTIKGFLW
ncbi:MAG: glycosyltransferase family 2 protein [Candidatus Lokiarchaeota archaeon]|nr:glycosyltransferase family 2 protein [Candidatus Lokiarchaeota archaeon]